MYVCIFGPWLLCTYVHAFAAGGDDGDGDNGDCDDGDDDGVSDSDHGTISTKTCMLATSTLASKLPQT